MILLLTKNWMSEVKLQSKQQPKKDNPVDGLKFHSLRQTLVCLLKLNRNWKRFLNPGEEEEKSKNSKRTRFTKEQNQFFLHIFCSVEYKQNCVYIGNTIVYRQLIFIACILQNALHTYTHTQSRSITATTTKKNRQEYEYVEFFSFVFRWV